MKIIPEPISFEWDEGNLEKNWNKHNVNKKEAEQVFNNEPIFFFEDIKHSAIEQRFGVFGITDKKRKLTIVFTIRKSKIRVIMARDMSRIERSEYVKKTNK